MDRFQEPAPLPDDATTLDTMKHRLKTKSGKAVYAKRKSTIEPVFGIIKSVMGFREFLLRRLGAVRGERDLVCIAFNLKRLSLWPNSLITNKRDRFVRVATFLTLALGPVQFSCLIRKGPFEAAL